MSDSEAVYILGFSGSLRQASFNTATLHAAQELKPPGMEIEIFDLALIPLYNGDVETAGYPPAVEQFKERIRASQGVLIVTPEYNYSISGVLKNALDWASRPLKDNPLARKPVAIMGAGGMFGTVRAQLHLRQILVELNSYVLAKPEVMIMRPWEKFDPQLKLSDEKSRQQIQALLVEFQHWVQRLTG